MTTEAQQRETERLRFEEHYDDWIGMPSGTSFELRMLDTYLSLKMSSAWVHWKAAVGLKDQEVSG